MTQSKGCDEIPYNTTLVPSKSTLFLVSPGLTIRAARKVNGLVFWCLLLFTNV